jgi:hypothetical protein
MDAKHVKKLSQSHNPMVPMTDPAGNNLTGLGWYNNNSSSGNN